MNQNPRCPEPGCQRRAMNGIEGCYCSDHYKIEYRVKALGKAINRLGRTLRGTP